MELVEAITADQIMKFLALISTNIYCSILKIMVAQKQTSYFCAKFEENIFIIDGIVGLVSGRLKLFLEALVLS